MPNLDEARPQLIAAIGLLEHSGIIDYNGHASLRLDDGSIAINSGASNRADVRPEDITLMDAGGKVGEGAPAAPKERFLHTEIYASRSDVKAIVHAHAPWSSLLSTSVMRYEPVYAQGALPGEVPLFPDVSSINTPALGGAVASTLGAGRAAIMQSHGIVVCGANLIEAVVLSIYLEENARRQIMAQCAGGYRAMTGEEVEAALKNLWDAALFQKAWNYFHAKWKRSSAS